MHAVAVTVASCHRCKQSRLQSQSVSIASVIVDTFFLTWIQIVSSDLAQQSDIRAAIAWSSYLESVEGESIELSKENWSDFVLFPMREND